MHRIRNQLTVAAVAFVLGLLVIVQLRTQQASPGLAALSAQDLTVLVANLNTRNDGLRTEIATIQQELDALAASQSRGQSSVAQIQADLARVRAWAGLDAVVGSGVTISVSGPVDAAAVEALVNELRNAGAEGISIEGVRVVAGTVIVGSGASLAVGDSLLADPFEVRAIGSPETLTGSLTRIGGLIAQLAATNPDAILTVTPVDRVQLPATKLNLVPSHAGPRL